MNIVNLLLYLLGIILTELDRIVGAVLLRTWGSRLKDRCSTEFGRPLAVRRIAFAQQVGRRDHGAVPQKPIALELLLLHLQVLTLIFILNLFDAVFDGIT